MKNIWLQLFAADRKNLPEATLTDHLQRVIVSSEMDNTDPLSLESFVENMPARDSRHTRRIYTTSPERRSSTGILCGNCGFGDGFEWRCRFFDANAFLALNEKYIEPVTKNFLLLVKYHGEPFYRDSYNPYQFQLWYLAFRKTSQTNGDGK